MGRVVLAVLEVVVEVVIVDKRPLLEQQTLAAEVAVLITTRLALRAVQVLSFFATPAQFNISLVAQ
jgi:hypothetical protein